jgi:adenosylcobalamin-dependent ribonucleoside-triphosphate reductase
MHANTHNQPSAFRPLFPGMGESVARRTILRELLTDEERDHLRVSLVKGKGTLFFSPADADFSAWVAACMNSGLHVQMDSGAKPMGRPPRTRIETWGDVADRVAEGNASLVPGSNDDRQAMRAHLANGSLLLSGRHLQHGDARQSTRPLEVFSNCSTAATSFLLLRLLLNGSGVGSSYDDDLRVVDWSYMPGVLNVLSETHPDFHYGEDVSAEEARHLYANCDRHVIWHDVGDTREGWSKTVEVVESLAYGGDHSDTLVIFNWSLVRHRGSPIMGMQGRPSSGPRPMMHALDKVARIKHMGMRPWKQAIFIDHFLSEPVLVGGARRAARIATKSWRDKDIIEFIHIKRPTEYAGLTSEEIALLRAEVGDHNERVHQTGEGFARFAPRPNLWSSNNSVMLDAEFFELLNGNSKSKTARQARRVWEAMTAAAYFDGTGEPGALMADRLPSNREGLEAMRGALIPNAGVSDEGLRLLDDIFNVALRRRYLMIVNPCGEISLSVFGGYCVIADCVPFFASTLAEGLEAMVLAARALIRTNTMQAVYSAEVARTNRIGVGLTGVHEFAWKFFAIGFRDLIRPDAATLATHGGEDALALCDTLRLHPDASVRAAAFWLWLGHCSREVVAAADAYADKLGVSRPHTVLTIKPAGTTSKLFGITEGWHLPALAHYLRYVQYRHGDATVERDRTCGYPVIDHLRTYPGHSIVGYPTRGAIADLGMGDAMVTAGEASMGDQYTWLRLGERFWLFGDNAHPERGNQISYTLKYDPLTTSYEDFTAQYLAHQPDVRACSVMPQEPFQRSPYEYLPETPIDAAEYARLMAGITRITEEGVDEAHLLCAGGACPI